MKLIEEKNIQKKDILDLLESGKTTTEIASLYNIGLTSVRNIYKYYNINLKYKNAQQDISKEVLQSLVDQGNTIKEMSITLNTSASTIQRKLKKFDISTLDITPINEEEFKELITNGYTINELKTFYNCSRERIDYYINKWSLGNSVNKTKRNTDKKVNNHRKIINIDIDELRSLYAGGYTQQKLATHFNCSVGKIIKTMKESNIKAKTKISHSDIKDTINSITNNEYTLLDDIQYKTSKTKLKIVHNSDICNNAVFDMTWNQFQRGNRCPKCKYIKLKSKRTKDTKWFKNNHAELTNGEYLILSDYTRVHDSIRIRHTICNHTFVTTPNRFQQGLRCPKCNLQSSIPEKEILNFINSHYKGEIISNSRKILDTKKEIDIYIPELKLGIEFNGLYWHSEEGSKGKCNKDYHIGKTESAIRNDIRLIQIFEDEWYNKRNIIESKLLHLLKLNNSPRVFPRKCYVSEVDVKTKNKFLEENHIQGKDTSSLNLGLYNSINSELVSVMTFSSLRKSLGFNSNDNMSFELSRFATNIKYVVPGGFSKLWKYFITNYEFNRIITYADRRWSVGGLYEVAGFKYTHSSKPSYSYTIGSTRFHRFTFRKNNLEKLFPNEYSNEKTEKEIMQEVGYKRIWDCGHLVYEYLNE